MKTKLDGVIGHSRKYGKMFPCVQRGLHYLYIAIPAICGGILLSCTGTEKTGEWRSYGSDPASTKYAPLDQINKTNIERLEIAWRWASIDQRLLGGDSTFWTWKNEATPVMAGGILYTSTSMSQVAAIDAANGNTIWTYDPESYKHGPPPGGFVHRGVAYWEAGSDKRVLIATGDARLIEISAATGKPVPTFGHAGQVDLTQGLRRPVDSVFYGITSPPIVCGGTAVVGSSIFDIEDTSSNLPLPAEMPPGDVRGFDVRSGQLRWRFESIPQGQNAGVETWENGSWKHTGAVNVWSLMSCDEKLGYVYLPFSTPSNDYYGGHRPGANLFGESLVALDARTGRRIWHFQAVHHGLWDYDLAAAPNLLDITVSGRRVKAVAQVSKQGFVYVFDRVTGVPIWPIEERPVPQSTAPGEETSPTQPFPTKPAPFDRQGISPDDLIDFTPALREEALRITKTYTYGSLFTPPSEKGTIMLPGVLGGASWAGAAVDPGKGVLYVPSITDSALITLAKSSQSQPDYDYIGTLQFGPVGPKGLPLFKPPYGRITAIDLNTGEHLWVRPMGDGPRDHPALQHLKLPQLGWPYRSFVLLTKSLLLVAQEGKVTGVRVRGNSIDLETKSVDPALLALDPKDGHLLAKIALPANATGTPLTYRARGRQYVVIPIGGASQPAELVALAIK